MQSQNLNVPGYEYRTGRPPAIFDLMPRAAKLLAIIGDGPTDELLPRAKVATWLDIGESSLQGLGALGLKQIAVGKRAYRRGDVLAFLRALAKAYEQHLKEQLAAAVAAQAEAKRSLADLARFKPQPSRRKVAA